MFTVGAMNDQTVNLDINENLLHGVPIKVTEFQIQITLVIFGLENQF